MSVTAGWVSVCVSLSLKSRAWTGGEEMEWELFIEMGMRLHRKREGEGGGPKWRHKSGGWAQRASGCPTNIGIVRGTVSMATIVVVSAGGQRLSCKQGFYITYTALERQRRC